jgi:hypothetical protein
VATSTTASTTASGMQVYRNEQFGFQFEWTTGDVLSDRLDVAFFPDTQHSKSPHSIFGATSDVGWQKNMIDDMTFSERWKPTKEEFNMPYGKVTKKTWVTNPTKSNSRSCEWYLEDLKEKYVVSMQCENFPTLDKISEVFSSSTKHEGGNDQYQLYRNEKLGLEFYWAKSDPLTQEENLSITAKNTEYTFYLASVDSNIARNTKNIQDALSNTAMHAKKTVYEESYGTMTKLEGISGGDSEPFCSAYIKNPSKNYIFSTNCENTLLSSLTFF